jgi:hypothetical protein
MCIILLAENKHLTKDILKKAENNNPHGSGIAWINQKTKKVEWIKAENLTADKIYKIIKSKKIQLPYIVHFRITSIGETCDELCHPFSLNAKLNENELSGSSEEGVLFHNGTMRSYKDHLDIIFNLNNEKLPSGKISDSRTMSYLASQKRLGFEYLERCTNGQKIAVLTPKGIKTFGDNWTNVKDTKCSNDHGMYYNACEGNIFSYGFNDNDMYGFYNNQSGKSSTCNNFDSSTMKQTKLSDHSKDCMCLKCMKKSEAKEIKKDKNQNALSSNLEIDQEIDLNRRRQEEVNRKNEKEINQNVINQENEEYFYQKLTSQKIAEIVNDLPLEDLDNSAISDIYDYLETLTLYSFDNLWLGTLDPETALFEILDKTYQMKFSEKAMKDQKVTW